MKPADGDIIDAEDLNANNREFADEFNGYLDRDNIEFQSLTSTHCKTNAFNKIYSDSTDTVFTVEGDRMDWNRIKNNNQVINKIVFEAPTDGIVICEWSGTWEFRSPYSSTNPDVAKLQLITLRIVAQNNEVTRIHRAADGKKKDSGYMCGVFEVSAGINIISVEAQTFKADNTSGEKTIATSANDIFIRYRDLIVNYRKR